ncbi:hypothetical protein D019_4689 [Vibrio parahaemolyticus VP2007-095]|nr:hypothetical protein D019_4689 [Vibrio parahaemolyticus VP2007-095]
MLWITQNRRAVAYQNEIKNTSLQIDIDCISFSATHRL